MDVPLHDAADSYLARGESFTVARAALLGPAVGVQLRVLLLPLVAMWVPLFKILPWVLRWRGNRVLERHYALLRDAEAGSRGGGAGGATAWIARLEVLRGQIEGLARRLPLPHQRDVYQCRVHVARSCWTKPATACAEPERAAAR